MMNKELQEFLDSWQIDPVQVKPAFMEYAEFLKKAPRARLEFYARPGISYSLRAKKEPKNGRELICLVDVVDDEPDNRWLSICFYADTITDPDEIGDFVPAGLLGEDALCFNLDENDASMKNYVLERLKEAVNN